MGDGLSEGSPSCVLYGACQFHNIIVPNIFRMHLYGPYANLCDIHVSHFIGIPLVKLQFDAKLCGGDRCEVKPVRESISVHRSHQESRSPVRSNNKRKPFDKTLGFVTNNTVCSDLPINASVDINDPVQYLQLASDIKASGVPNHLGMHVPLPATFDLKYITREIAGFHDQKLLDYLTFGFPLGLDPNIYIASNKNDNHASAWRHAEAIDEYIAVEKGHGALFGPFESKPHPDFTWSPLMTRPKGAGHRVILNLSFGDFSVNKATPKGVYEVE